MGHGSSTMCALDRVGRVWHWTIGIRLPFFVFIVMVNVVVKRLHYRHGLDRICIYKHIESSLVVFGDLDDNPVKGLKGVLSVGQVLSVKLVKFNTSVQV